MELSKRPIFDWFFSQGDVLVTINTQVDGVDVPAHLREQEVVDFILGEAPTPKMTMDDNGVSASMRFSGALYSCFFPWLSILQMSGKDAVIQFRNPMMGKNEAEAKAGLRANQNKKKRANLRLVK